MIYLVNYGITFCNLKTKDFDCIVPSNIETVSSLEEGKKIISDIIKMILSNLRNLSDYDGYKNQTIEQIFDYNYDKDNILKRYSFSIIELKNVDSSKLPTRYDYMDYDSSSLWGKCEKYDDCREYTKQFISFVRYDYDPIKDQYERYEAFHGGIEVFHREESDYEENACRKFKEGDKVKLKDSDTIYIVDEVPCFSRYDWGNVYCIHNIDDEYEWLEDVYETDLIKV